MIRNLQEGLGAAALIRVAAMSDLHVEFDRASRRSRPQHPNDHHPLLGPDLRSLREHQPDLMLLAGDVDIGLDAVAYSAEVRQYLGCPVALVPGNHEYYGLRLHETLEQLRHAGATQGVHVLDEDELILDIRGRKIRLLGVTLWTDYELNGYAEQAIRYAKFGLNDHKLIELTPGERFEPAHALELHQHSRAWLTDKFATPFEGTTIVVTHHGVSTHAIEPRYERSDLGPAFLSNLEKEILSWAPSLWVTGHTHFDHDQMLGTTRMVSRQRGYPGERSTPFHPWVGEL